MSYKIHHIRIIRRWHGRIGFIAAIFLVFLVISGLALNHGEALKLDKQEIRYPWLMHWYGIHASAPSQGFLLGKSYFSWEGDKWALGNRLLSGSAERPVGAVEVSGIDFIATPANLFLYQPDGQLVDKITTQSLPAHPILALGMKDDKIVLRTQSALFASVDGLSWETVNDNHITWSSAKALPNSVRKQLTDVLAPGLPAQRILLDVHSGRLFGRYGPWFVDLAATALLMLSLSGFWIYWRSIKQSKLQHNVH